MPLMFEQRVLLVAFCLTVMADVIARGLVLKIMSGDFQAVQKRPYGGD